MAETLLPKRIALPLFASDALSSVAYAPDEILLTLSLAGMAAVTFSWWIGLLVAVVMLVVVASYRQFTGVLMVFLLARAFSSGCAALTGVEAISNGVPAFCKPKSHNAAATLLLLGTIAVSMLLGIIALALAAGATVLAFDADVTRLIQLYVVGVFVSFTVSQLGMMRHWGRHLHTETDPRRRTRMRRSRAINAIGLTFTATVLLVVLVSKFTHGAWMALLAMVVVFAVMKGINRHYRAVARETAWVPGRGAYAAEPRPRRRRGRQDQQADTARRHVRQGLTPVVAGGDHGRRRPGGDRRSGGAVASGRPRRTPADHRLPLSRGGRAGGEVRARAPQDQPAGCGLRPCAGTAQRR